MIKYKTVIEWSEEDGCYVVSIPALKGCIAHGESYEEAAHEVSLVTEMWIKTAKAMKMEFPPHEAEVGIVTVSRIVTLLKMLKLSSIATDASINKQTLATKVRRRSELNIKESKALTRTLRKTKRLISHALREF